MFTTIPFVFRYRNNSLYSWNTFKFLLSSLSCYVLKKLLCQSRMQKAHGHILKANLSWIPQKVGVTQKCFCVFVHFFLHWKPNFRYSNSSFVKLSWGGTTDKLAFNRQKFAQVELQYGCQTCSATACILVLGLHHYRVEIWKIQWYTSAQLEKNFRNAQNYKVIKQRKI